MAELYGIEKNPVQGKEDGNLDEYGETAAQGIDFMRSVKLHGSAIQFLLVVFVFFF